MRRSGEKAGLEVQSLPSKTPCGPGWLCNREKVSSGQASVSLSSNERFALHYLLGAL